MGLPYDGASNLERYYLNRAWLCIGVTLDSRPGGLVTTTIDSGQQWDVPNGWAPQWIAKGRTKPRRQFLT